MMQYRWPNCLKTIKTELKTLSDECREILAHNLLGIYLHGSLAQGGFNPTRSDINILVVTSQEIEMEAKRKVIDLLLRVSKAPSPLDVNFLLAQDNRPLQLPLGSEFAYNEALRGAYLEDRARGTFQNRKESSQSDYKLVISLKVVCDQGVVLEGKPVPDVISPVSEEVFRAALVQSFQDQYNGRLRNLVSFVLNSCRTLAYLQEGRLLSKDEGGPWGLRNLPEQYTELIQQSLALYRDEKLGRPVGRSVVDDFSTFMRDHVLHSY